MNLRGLFAVGLALATCDPGRATPPAATGAPPAMHEKPAAAVPPPLPEAVREALNALWKLVDDGPAGDRAGDEAWARPAAVLVDALERPASEDDLVQIAQTLYDAQWRRGLPDALARRILRIARAYVPTCPPPASDTPMKCVRGAYRPDGLDVMLGRLAVAVDAERAGAFAELRELVASRPHTTFQAVLVEEMLVWHPASRARVELLGDLVAHGARDVQLWALDALVRPGRMRLPRESCAALASGMASSSPEVAVTAAIHVAAWPCGALRERALDDLGARAQAGSPLTSASLPRLCGDALEERDRARPRALLRSIALHAWQPLAVRRDAMVSLRMCEGSGWPGVLAALLRDPDARVREAAAGVDHMITGQSWDP